jgi:hypothetical protein
MKCRQDVGLYRRAVFLRRPYRGEHSVERFYAGESATNPSHFMKVDDCRQAAALGHISDTRI